MIHRTVAVKNVARLSEAGTALINRGMGQPGMGLIWGATGYGKTTAVAWFANKCRGIHVRALAVWTPAAMLSAICHELGLVPKGSCAAMVNTIVERLAEEGCPLFLDEADYILDSKRMVETLRDLHDMATVPVILIGMAGIERKIAHRQQLTGRIAQWVEFQPADLDDACLLARQMCEVKVADDLIHRLHAEAKGSIRLLVVGLGRIEHAARARGLDRIGVAQWGGEFFLGAAPAVKATPALPAAQVVRHQRAARG